MFLYVVAFLFFLASAVSASPATTTYQAKIIKPNGYPLETSNVNFKFTILDPAGSCILYAETYSAVNMANSAGVISFSLGSGVKTYPVSATTFKDVFSNVTPSLSCDVSSPVSSYSPQADDIRKIVMQFNDGSGWQTLPAMAINAVPYAMYANEAQKLNGFSDSDFVKTSTLTTCGASEALRFNGVSFSCVAVGNAGAITSNDITTALGYTPATGASFTALSSSLNATDATLSSVSSTVFSVSSTVASLNSAVSSLSTTVAASFAAITSSQWSNVASGISYSAGNVGIGTAIPDAKLVVNSNSAYVSAPANTGVHVVGADSLNALITLDSAGASPKIVGRRASNTIASPNAVLNGNYLLSLEGHGHSGTSYSTTPRAQIVMAADQNWSSSGQGTLIFFSTTASGATTANERMRITNSGNVGIGTNNPVTTLDVVNSGYKQLRLKGTSSSSQELWAGSVANTVGSYIGNNAYYDVSYQFIPNYTAASGLNFRQDGSTEFWNDTGLTIGTNYVPTKRMVITNTGNIGIGTTTPSAKLHLAAGTSSTAPLKLTAGTLLSSAQSGTIEYDGSQLYFTDSANTRRAIATNSNPGSFENTNLISNTSGNITLSPNNTTGSVVVSATTASTNFDTGALVVKGGLGVAGNINTAADLNVSGSSVIDGSLRLTALTSGSVLFAGNNGVVSQDNTNFFWDNVNKRLGIGTQTPTTQLEVASNSGNSALRLSRINSASQNASVGFFPVSLTASTPAWNFGLVLGSNNFTLNSHDGSSLSTRMTIDTSGNVGIGTSALTARLSVSKTLVGADNEIMTLQNAPTSGWSTTPGYLQQLTWRDHSNIAGAIGMKYNPSGASVDFTVNSLYNGGAYQPSSNISFIVRGNGNVGVGTTTPTARLHLASGTTATASLKITSGALLASPADGAIEYDGTSLYYTDATNTRRALASTSGNQIYSGNQTYSGQINVANNTTSTNSTTGALVVSGGVGVGGNINASGTIVTSSNIQGASITATSGVATNIVQGNSNLLLNPNGGNVGIGASSPQKKLHLTGLGDILRVGPHYPTIDATTDRDYIDLVAHGTDTRVSSANERFHVENVSGSLILQGSGGNVGIGTTSPTALLEVSGSIKYNGPLSSGYTTSTFTDAELNTKFGYSASTTGTFKQLQLLRDDTYTANMSIIEGIHTSSMLFSTYDHTGYGTNGFFFGKVPFNGNYKNDGITLFTIRNTGNVGIGTVNPNINASGGRALHIHSPTTDGGFGAAAVHFTNGTTGSSASAGLVVGRWWNNQNLFWDYDGSNSTVFGTSGTERLRITAAGRVGIGTSTPQAALDVSGGVQVLHGASNGLRFSANPGGGSGDFSTITYEVVSGEATALKINVNDNPEGPSADELHLSAVGGIRLFTSTATASATERMIVRSNGNVGIGTSSPSRNLEISSNTGLALLKMSTTASGSQPGIQVTSGNGTWNPFINFGINGTDGNIGSIYGNAPDSSMRFNTNGSDRLTITSTGNVGIGTATPASKLELAAGDISISDNNHRSGKIRLYKEANTADEFVSHAIGTEGFHNTYGAGVSYTNSIGHRFYRGGGELIAQIGFGGAGTASNRLNSYFGGNVGIGTITPSNRLHVRGDYSLALEGVAKSTKWLIGTSNDPANSSINFWSDGIGAGTANRFNISENGNITMAVNGGNVGIGTTSPQARLHVGGTVRVDSLAAATATQLCIDGNSVLAACSSSKRYKENVLDLDSSLSTILKLRPVSYDWIKSKEQDVGFIAEEVEQVDSRLVTYNKENKIQGVKYDQLTAPIVKALQELYFKILGQQENLSATNAKIQNLEFENQVKDRRIQSLEQENSAIKAYLCQKDPTAPICK